MKKILVFVLIFVFTALTPAWADLSNPSGLNLTATSTSIMVSWTTYSDQDSIDGFKITYYESDDDTTETTVTIEDTTATSHAITGLIADTKYYVELIVYDGSDESSGIYDTITTTQLDVSITLEDRGVISIDMSDYEDDVNTYDWYIGVNSMDSADRLGLGDLDESDLTSTLEDFYTTGSGTGVDVSTVTTVPDLDDGTYYILVLANYNDGNLGISDEIEFDVGDFSTFFSQTGDIENGCFIESSSGTKTLPWAFFLMLVPAAFCLARFRRVWVAMGSLALVLTVFFSSSAQCFESVEYQNLFGIKAGLFEPSESGLGDNYDSIVPVSLFYERMFGRYFSLDVSAGYTRASGNAVTASGDSTGVDADLDLIPVSASANLNIPVHPLITCYLGLGGDYWTFEEDSFYGKEKNDLGGYHGKVGVKLFTGDIEYFRRGGILLEANYTVLDRFGDNDVDLGGWIYNLGVMYCF